MSSISKVFFGFFFIFFFVVSKINGAEFGYANPNEWIQEYPTCGGSRQSPVDLRPMDMARLTLPSVIQWTGYKAKPLSMSLQSNGHTVELSATWSDNKVPYISGGVLTGDYAFAQLHFHWGPRNNVGSEHTINNYSLPLEMHIVHYKKDYGSIAEALKYEDGLAVVGFLFTIGKSRNKGIARLELHKNCVKLPNSKVEIKPFALDEFKVYFKNDYVAYLGSLTTPPCSEIVTWILPSIPRIVTRRQADDASQWTYNLLYGTLNKTIIGIKQSPKKKSCNKSKDEKLRWFYLQHFPKSDSMTLKPDVQKNTYVNDFVCEYHDKNDESAESLGEI